MFQRIKCFFGFHQKSRYLSGKAENEGMKWYLRCKTCHTVLKTLPTNSAEELIAWMEHYLDMKLLPFQIDYIKGMMKK